MKNEFDGIKKIVNEIQGVREFAEGYKKAVAINVLDMSSILAKNYLPKIAELTRNTARAVNNMQLEIASQVNKAIQGIVASIPKINRFFEAEEFKRFAESLSKKQKSKFVDYLANDWYIPLDILQDFPILLPSGAQSEIDEFVLSVFSELKQEHDVDVLDFVPKSLRTYKDKNTLEILLHENLYKQAVIFCMERIERVITTAQSVNEYKNIKINSKGLLEFKRIVKEKSADKGYISEVFKMLEVDEDSIRMFKPFFKFLEEDSEVLPLNRNLFFHGWIEEEKVDECLVIKAILAWAFFEKLSIESQKGRDKVPIGISRVKKYRKNMGKEKPQTF
ncbi:hypothetical protein [Lactovum miscens]|uniref:Uncharacterized protein n=1 Tax=Lactovum miscens TaxID=190387 RepID=A0A841C8A6_9LACT|nr:hypothetical protein [Lactovum miscens]MBB5887629.1 hypothetical protein [Lactovum miscens]